MERNTEDTRYHKAGSPKLKEEREGKTYPSKVYGEMLILEYTNSRTVRIRFLNTGFEKVTQWVYIKEGTVKDPYCPIINGVGYLGDGPIKNRTIYQSWKNMIARCYDETSRGYSSYGGRGVTVNVNWHNYQNFQEWSEGKFQKGFEIDKDLLSGGLASEYSPETCAWVPLKLNKLFIRSQEGKNVPTPLGVFMIGSHKKCYRAISSGEEKAYLGDFETPLEAFEVFKKSKQKIASSLAQKFFDRGQITREVRDAVVNYPITPFYKDLSDYRSYDWDSLDKEYRETYKQFYLER